MAITGLGRTRNLSNLLKLCQTFKAKSCDYQWQGRIFLSEIAPNRQDGVIVSESCVKRLKQICKEDFLRVTVEGGGCSGFQYKFQLDSKLEEDDNVFEKEGVKVVIDSTSLDFIRGSTVDYQTELIRAAFCITDNPKAETGCSCGASFSVKID